MLQGATAVLKPRKMPVQARSAASVEAIFEATLQVLVSVGKARLTTTRVAARAGVSVGTLYQYFPNKGALLQGALRRHMNEVAEAVERTCERERGGGPEQMAEALVSEFLRAKMRGGRSSKALYEVSEDVGGTTVVREMTARMNRAMTAMLETMDGGLQTEPEIVATMLQGTMAGVSRRLLESAAPEREIERYRLELVSLVGSYLRACRARPGTGG